MTGPYFSTTLYLSLFRADTSFVGRFALVVILIWATSVSAQNPTNALRTEFARLSDEGQYAEALKVGHDLVKAWQQEGNADSAAYYTYRRAHTMGLAGYHEACIATCDSLLTVWRWHKPSPTFLGGLYYTTGSNYFFLGMLSQAEALLDTSLIVESQLPNPDTLTLAKSTEWKGIVYIYFDSLSEATRLIERALELRYAAFDSTAKEIGYNLNSLASVYEEQGRLSEAHDTYTAAYEILSHHLSDEHPHVLSILSNLSSIKADIGQVAEATRILKKAIAGHKKLGMDYPLMSEYFNLGSIYLSFGDYARAEPYMLHAIAIGDSLLPKPHYHRANMYDGLGGIYFHKELPQKADSLFLMALEERLDIEDIPQTELAQSYFNRGMAAQLGERYADAFRFYQHSYDLRSKSLGPQNPKTVNALYALAEILWQEGKFDEAIDKFEKSDDLYQASLGPRHRWTLEAKLKLAQSHHALGEYEEARVYLRRIWNVVYDTQESKLNLKQLSHIEPVFLDPFLLDVIDFHFDFLLQHPSQLGDDVVVQSHYLRRITEKTMDQLWPLLNFDGNNDYLMAKIKNIYDKSILLAITSKDVDDEIQGDVFNAIEQGRSAAIRAAHQHRSAMRYAEVPEAVIEKDREMRENLKYIDAQARTADPEHWQELRFKQLEEFQAHKSQLERQYPRWYAMLYQTREIESKELHRRLQVADASLLVYVDIDTALIAITADGKNFQASILDLPQGWRDSVETFIGFMKNAGSASASERYIGLGHSLYQMLWAPIKSQLSTRVHVIPDGILNYLNFETLIVSPPPGKGLRQTRWLIQDHNILLAGNLPKQEKVEKVDRGGILAIAPGFSDDMKTAYRKSLPANAKPDSIFMTWTRTPWSLELAEKISAQGEALLGPQATKIAFRDKAEQAQILHFGTHARLQDQEPLLSYLALTPNPPEDDGYLYAHELYNRNLNAKLAVLTACETGLGAYRHGEGVISLAHAFEYAGCPTVIYSLWQIDDEYSTRIIESFYRHLDEGLPISDALRNAKLDHIRNGNDELASPYYWAGLVVRGDDGKIDVRPNRNHAYWWSASILLSVFALALLVNRRKKYVKDE